MSILISELCDLAIFTLLKIEKYMDFSTRKYNSTKNRQNFQTSKF